MRDYTNVIFFIVDDQGVSDVEMNPHATPINMPNLTRLAKEGVSCTNGYANATMCAPSRAGIMLGGYQQRAGIYRLPHAIPGISQKIAPEFFKDMGYKTALIGKWHLGGLLYPETGPLNKGFDQAFYWHGSTHDYWSPSIGNTALFDPLVTYSPIMDDEEEVEDMDYLTREITKRSLAFIEENKNELFFLNIMHHVPHLPLQLPVDYYDKYAQLGLGPLAAATRGMYEILDEGLGEVLDKLEETGLRENTLIIYTSDNGAAVPDGPVAWPYQGSKFNTMEAGIRVPFIFSWPGKLQEDKLYFKPVMHKDMLPTVLAAVGEENPGREGVNLLPYLRGENKDEPNEVLFWSDFENHGNMAVRKGQWKLTRNIYSQGLFNLSEDLEEKNDLSKQHPKLVKELLSLYNDWFSKNAPVQYTESEQKRVQKLKAEVLANPETPRYNFTHQFGPEYGK